MYSHLQFEQYHKGVPYREYHIAFDHGSWEQDYALIDALAPALVLKHRGGKRRKNHVAAFERTFEGH